MDKKKKISEILASWNGEDDACIVLQQWPLRAGTEMY